MRPAAEHLIGVTADGVSAVMETDWMVLWGSMMKVARSATPSLFRMQTQCCGQFALEGPDATLTMGRSRSSSWGAGRHA